MRSETPDPFDPYVILDIPRDADAATIKKAYRRESQRHHPDRPGGTPEAMALVNRANDILSDPERRWRFDEAGDTGPAADAVERVRNEIRGAIDHLLDQVPEGADLLYVLRDSIREGNKQTQLDLAKSRRKLEKLRKRLGLVRLKNPAAGENLFTQVLEHRIAKEEATIKELEQRACLNDAALEMLEDYENNPDSGIEIVRTLPRWI